MKCGQGLEYEKDGSLNSDVFDLQKSLDGRADGHSLGPVTHS